MLLITLEDLKQSEYEELKNIVPSDMEVCHVSDELEGHDIALDQVKIWITYGHDVSDALLDQMPKLEWIQIFQAGVEHLPFEEIEKRNITLTNMRGIHGIPMAEYTMSMLFHLMGNIQQYHEDQHRNRWNDQALFHEIHGKTVTIFGAGTIGTEIATKLKAMGLHVIGVNSSAQDKAPFDGMYKLEDRLQVLSKSDFVILLMPVTPDTQHFMSTQEFKEMKTSAYIMNLGRGPLIDEEALIHALEQEEIQGAVLDVFDEEPLPREHPYWQLENVIITPHVAAKSPRYIERCIDQFSHNIQVYPRVFEMKYVIDTTKGY